MIRPIATFALVAATVLAYFAAGDPSVYGFIPAHATFGSMLTSLFLHASWLHLSCNMVFLAIFGTVVERSVGHLRLLALYGAAGVGGCLMHVLVNPASTSVLVGSSGAVFGLLAVAAVLQPRLLGFVGGVILLNIWCSFNETGSAAGCHLGGFAVGFLFCSGLRTDQDKFCLYIQKSGLVIKSFTLTQEE
jgi:membrane associated rhomboid family serine protease